MPTINLTQLGLIAAKALVMIAFFSLFVSFMSNFSSMLISIIGKLFGSVGAVGSLNLGYVAGAIGLDVFINNLLSSVYIAGSVYVSAMITILIFKNSVTIYKLVMGS